MPVEIILLKDLPEIGNRGDLIQVKPGFARNYLLPKKLAALLSSREAQDILIEVRERKIEKKQKIEVKKNKKIELEEKRKESQIRKKKLLGES